MISAKANRNQAWGDDKSQPAALQYLTNPVAQKPGLSAILHILSKWCAVTKPLSSMNTAEWEGTLLPVQIESIIIQKQLTSILCLSLSCFSGQLENSITCRCWPKYSKAAQMFNGDHDQNPNYLHREKDYFQCMFYLSTNELRSHLWLSSSYYSSF